MARIQTNVSALVARHNLARTNEDLSVRLQRLSTGLRINRGKDDPAGLIVSERLRSEISGINAAIDNAERASNVIATGEAALNEVAALLNSIKSLTVEAANEGGLSEEEIEANQLEIDDAVASITRIASTTSFAGLKLLDGSLDYTVSGLPNADISDVAIHQANFGTAPNLPVNVEVVSSAERASLFLSTGSATLTSSVTFEVTGPKGAEVLEFVSGTALSAVEFAIDRVSDATGVNAIITSGAGGAGTSALQFQTTEFGTDAFVSVEKLPGTPGGDFFQTHNALGGAAVDRDSGEDVLALVNGTLALGEGTVVKLNSSGLNLEMQLSDSFAQTNNTQSFTVVGGGAKFQLGPEVNTSQQISLGLQAVNAQHLGDPETGFLRSITSGGSNSLISGNAAKAGSIIDRAITQVATMRGRLGAFERNTLQTNVNSLQIALENVTASESQIRDADFAEETAAFTRAQLLSNVGTTVLATANQSASNVLQLLQ
mgnify:CR=1 FL=1